MSVLIDVDVFKSGDRTYAIVARVQVPYILKREAGQVGNILSVN